MDQPALEPWKSRFRGIRVAEVSRAVSVTPLMRRITFAGPELVNLPRGPNVKLLIPPPGHPPEWPRPGPDGTALWPPAERRPISRTYSVRRDDRTAAEIDVDFVLHGNGPAARWAADAKPGDVVGIGGPGGLTVHDAGFYLLAGDHSALPAIARILEDLPAEAKGRAYIEVPGPAEEQELRSPAGLAVVWLHRATEAGRSPLLAENAQEMEWPDDPRIFVWAGAESSTARAIKAYARDGRGLDRRHVLAMGYWRVGMSETEYHRLHDHDRGEDYHLNKREQEVRL